MIEINHLSVAQAMAKDICDLFLILIKIFIHCFDVSMYKKKFSLHFVFNSQSRKRILNMS